MSSAATIAIKQRKTAEFSADVAAALIRPLHALTAAPGLVFAGTLVLMLFRPPDVGFFPFDRLAFFLLVFVIWVRTGIVRDRLPFIPSLTVPMACLLAVAVLGTVQLPFEPRTWSLLGAKFVVPFFMFHLAAIIFRSGHFVRQFELACICILIYLCLVSVAWLMGAAPAILPPYIANPGLGIHIDRARGPFLQAAANGTAINLLALIAITYTQGKRSFLLSAFLSIVVPMAVFATMTRAVWLSFALSVPMVAYRKSWQRRMLLAFGIAAILITVSHSPGLSTMFFDRFEERSPIEFRQAIYRLSWEMFKEKPILGWGQNQFAPEIEARISDFRPQDYAAHNTFIELAVEHGTLGIALYAWMIVGLFRLALKGASLMGSASVGPIFLAVYLLNACFVVMNYQFVNALVFSFAGLIAAQSHAFPPLCGCGAWNSETQVLSS